ncbi:MAG: Crp/Fnr family transcriptional regulator [Hyphomicrobiales bacterium]|nr:Crp/Fnr family transcriptional regulator [Hyphomicrobiales bacterium]
MATNWLDDFAPLAGLEPAARPLLSDLPPIDIDAGKILFAPGQACAGFAIILSGSVRVGVTGENGRSIVLYRVARGEVCVQTTLCLMAGLEYTAEGVTETPVTLVMAPASRCDALIAQSRVFRTFIFGRFGARLSDISRLLEQIAFARIDTRVAQALLARADAQGRVTATHQALAEEIGTAREVVSRQLEAFSRAGLVRLSRGEVGLLDRAGVEDRARG